MIVVVEVVVVDLVGKTKFLAFLNSKIQTLRESFLKAIIKIMFILILVLESSSTSRKYSTLKLLKPYLDIKKKKRHT